MKIMKFMIFDLVLTVVGWSEIKNIDGVDFLVQFPSK